MNYKVIFAPEASHDLENLLVYLIDEAGPETARSYVGKIVDYCLSFETFPKRGALRVFHRGQDVSFDDSWQTT